MCDDGIFLANATRPSANTFSPSMAYNLYFTEEEPQLSTKYSCLILLVAFVFSQYCRLRSRQET